MGIISVSNLKKYYQVHKKEPGFWGAVSSFVNRKYLDVKAVDGVSFEINEGELIGFIGPNGAGKTTTLKVLSGLLYPTSGQISVLGKVPFKREKQFQNQISLIMGQKNQLWWDLPPMDSFILFKEIYEINEWKFKETLNKLLEMLNVGDILTTPVRKLSLGQRMKCELVAALLHSPKMLFLDEPTIGLDVVAQQSMREFIKEYNQEFKATIILTSHYMADVKELCKRIIIIDKGIIVYNGLLDKIIHKFAPVKVIKVDFEKEVALEKIKELGIVKRSAKKFAEIHIKKEKVSEITTKLLSGFGVADLTIEDPAIEDIIREIFSIQR